MCVFPCLVTLPQPLSTFLALSSLPTLRPLMPPFASSDDAADNVPLSAFALLCLLRLKTYLVELAADSAGLLGTEVEGDVLLALVELAEVGTLLLVHDGEHAGNVLAERVDAEDLAGRTTGNLLDAKVEELGLELLELLGKVSLGLRLKLECLNLNLMGHNE